MIEIKIQLGGVTSSLAAANLAHTTRTIHVDSGEDAKEWAEAEAEHLGLTLVGFTSREY